MWKSDADRKRLVQQKNLHDENETSNHQVHSSEECLFRTIVKVYSVDHARMMHRKDGQVKCTPKQSQQVDGEGRSTPTVSLTVKIPFL